MRLFFYHTGKISFNVKDSIISFPHWPYVIGLIMSMIRCIDGRPQEFSGGGGPIFLGGAK